ncbi:MAG TPA: hypothetical protein EYP43_03365 [Thermoplasmata archaeon]|nr:hypothetical protein [Thermoplasmata archaeon]
MQCTCCCRSASSRRWPSTRTGWARTSRPCDDRMDAIDILSVAHPVVAITAHLAVIMAAFRMPLPADSGGAGGVIALTSWALVRGSSSPEGVGGACVGSYWSWDPKETATLVLFLAVSASMVTCCWSATPRMLGAWSSSWLYRRLWSPSSGGQPPPSLRTGRGERRAGPHHTGEHPDRRRPSCALPLKDTGRHRRTAYRALWPPAIRLSDTVPDAHRPDPFGCAIRRWCGPHARAGLRPSFRSPRGVRSPASPGRFRGPSSPLTPRPVAPSRGPSR